MNGRGIARFIILCVFQIFVFNNLVLWGHLSVFPYVLIVLLLPLNWHTWTYPLVGFITGMLIDFSTGTIGCHAAASTLMGYLRVHWQRVLQPKEGYDDVRVLPCAGYMGIAWFLKYVIPLVLIHHVCLFFLDRFRVMTTTDILLDALGSVCLSMVFILLYQLFMPRKQ